MELFNFALVDSLMSKGAASSLVSASSRAAEIALPLLSLSVALRRQRAEGDSWKLPPATVAARTVDKGRFVPNLSIHLTTLQTDVSVRADDNASARHDSAA